MPTRVATIVDGDVVGQLAVSTSAGAADVGRIPELNADGELDPTIVGGATTGNNVVLMTGPTGRIDESVMPVGFGTDAKTIEASEDLSAGNLINIHMVGPDFFVRRADASNGRAAHGYVLNAFLQGEQALVYREGTNNQVNGLTSPKVYLGLTPGSVTSTAPNASGQLLQRVGTADEESSFYFSTSVPILLQ